MNTNTITDIQARDFACKHLCGFMDVTINQFLEAQGTTPQWIITDFHKNIVHYDHIDGVFYVGDLLEAWNDAKRYLPLSDFSEVVS